LKTFYSRVTRFSKVPSRKRLMGLQLHTVRNNYKKVTLACYPSVQVANSSGLVMPPRRPAR
jgi:hypothetical protein